MDGERLRGTRFATRRGLARYLLDRNDRVWEWLTPRERHIVLDANALHNAGRDDWARPERFAARESFDTDEDRLATRRGQLLHAFLARHRPARVLEIGPGPGFFTRMIVDAPSLARYEALDINGAFLAYLEERIGKRAAQGRRIETAFHCGGLAALPDGPFDAIVLLSALHHIPDRAELLRALAGRLSAGGHIFAADPTHYAPRILQLLTRFRTRRYLDPALYREYVGHLSTHHFCTLGEYRRLCREGGCLEIEAVEFTEQRWARVARRGWLARWSSREMVAVLRAR